MFERNEINRLRSRLRESPRFLIVVSGPRQVGKTTLVRQALHGFFSLYVAADQTASDPPDLFRPWENTETVAQSIPGTVNRAEWLVYQWNRARVRVRELSYGRQYILAVDEIQKIPRWSEIVKGLWDEDRAEKLPLHVILLGSSPWLMEKGLTESLAGRFESIPLTHWSYDEMQTAFDVSLEEYIYFGGYPGSTALIRDEDRWRDYIRAAMIRPNIEKDILQMTRVDKPALLKALFELGCGAYSGQIVSYTKLLGQLQDAGNTVTLAHYLDLLSQAGLLKGLSKYAEQKHRQRASSPKMNALNTALISALSGYSFAEARQDRSFWGRMVESAVGAHLINTAPDLCRVHYWRESPHEVDFVLVKGRVIVAVEVKSGIGYLSPKGLSVFAAKFKEVRQLIIGEGGIPLTEFFLHPVEYWLEQV